MDVLFVLTLGADSQGETGWEEGGGGLDRERDRGGENGDRDKLRGREG